MDMERLTRVHLKMRAAKAKLTKDYEAAKAALEADMATIEGAMQGTLIQNKVKSMGSAAGTVYLERKQNFNCVDWPAYYAWMAETGSFEGLEKRVGKTFVLTHMKENDDELPPGITVYEEQVVRVRVGNE